MTRAIKAFFGFWWDFLVGDTPELTIGVLIALGAVDLLPHGSEATGAVLVAIVVATVAVSLLVEVRRKAVRNGQPRA